eukprot:6065478-Pleurochrysis_carterae.AAC.1
MEQIGLLLHKQLLPPLPLLSFCASVIALIKQRTAVLISAHRASPANETARNPSIIAAQQQLLLVEGDVLVACLRSTGVGAALQTTEDAAETTAETVQEKAEKASIEMELCSLWKMLFDEVYTSPPAHEDAYGGEGEKLGNGHSSAVLPRQSLAI